MIRSILFALTMIFASPVLAIELDALTDAERAALRAEIRAYLLENPEIIMEAMDVLDERERKARAEKDRILIQANADAIFNDGFSFVGGNPDGDIVFVEFLDYRCEYCKRAYPEVEKLIAADGNIRYIIKEWPILGEQSEIASRFAIATQLIEGDAAYKAVHDTLMQFNGDITVESLTRLSAELEMDTLSIFSKMLSDDVSHMIAQNNALARSLNITGTPTFVIEDQMMRSYVPLEQMEQIVAALREGQ